jgi:glycosyltransferase involved in cell wall biosynthesis
MFVRGQEEVAVTERSARKIFVIHPSALLTDHYAHGDGLLTYRFIYELSLRGYEISVACEAVELSKPFPDTVRLYPIKLASERFGFVKRVEYAWRMRRLFKRLDSVEHFDIAHQLNPVYAGLSLGLLGISVPIVLGPYVAHWPFRRTSKAKTVVLDAISRVQQALADGIIISGEVARTRIVSRHFRRANIFTVPYGIDLEMFPDVPISAQDPTILYLAGLSARKGILILLEAFETVAARLPNVRLVVAGDGPEREQARAMAQRSVHRDRIEFCGSIARRDVPATLAQCTVYCSSSFGEPYGMSLIEAMATGRPVVATAAGGPLDLVDPDGGVLVPPGDSTALANALVSVLANPETARGMGQHNRRAVAAYAWPRVIDRLEAVYHTVVDRRSAATARSSR